ncbi:MAG TPA: hypothetical protein VMZ71_17110 [Gemmataceae bacterium]|nr:hypothetical protein [Gemmataceae bacterium]
MKSNLKTIVLLALLFGVVFGVILVVQYTPKVDEKADDINKTSSNEPPLRFFTSTRKWDPESEVLEDRVFPGFFEKDSKGTAVFWFENRNDKPVVVQLKGVSCSSCSDGWLAPLPPQTTRDILQMAAVSSLPLGPVSFLPVGMVGPAAAIEPTRLERQSHEFRNMDWAFNVPAAKNDDKWSPQWGMLALNFKAGPRQELSALFQAQVKGTSQFAENEFRIAYTTANAFEVPGAEILVGDLTDSSTARSYEIPLFSATRGPGTAEQLSPPNVKVMMPAGATGDPGPFVGIGTPVQLLGKPFDDYAAELPQKLGKGPDGEFPKIRVRSAYRIPVTVTPKVGEQRLDIGALERELWIACGDAQPRLVRVKGTVHGGMWLSAGGKDIDLKQFRYQVGFPEGRFELVTDNPSAEVVLSKTEVEERDAAGELKKVTKDHVVVNGKVAPDILKVSVERQDRKESDRGYYWIKVAVPPDAHQGQLVNSYVVVEIKGPNPRRFRIPVKGSGTR